MILGPRRRALALVLCVAFATACSSTPDRVGPTTAEQQKDNHAAVEGTFLRKGGRVRSRLAVIGDFGDGGENERRVARAIKRWTAERRVKGLITTGDNIYPAGHPDSFREAWHEPYGWVSRRGLPLLASLGNHDVGTDDGRPVMDLLDMPARWYVRHLEAVDVFVLDSTRAGSERQRRWLRRELKRSTRAWQVAVFHHPPFTCGLHGPDRRTKRKLVPILRKHGTDLVLNGHEHSYQRFALRRGVTYVVTGGGGALLYPLGSCAPDMPVRVAADDSHHHFLKLKARPRGLEVAAVTPSGIRVDLLRLRR